MGIPFRGPSSRTAASLALLAILATGCSGGGGIDGKYYNSRSG